MIHEQLANFGPFFLLLGILIFVHEMGHFLVAKFFNVRVETFSLGFGPKIFSMKLGETTYALSLIPLGGYVKMFGDDPSVTVSEGEKHRAFLHKPILQRIAVVLAGPLMNLFFAIVLFTAIGGLGEDQASPFVGDIQADSKAYTEGFRSGDKVLAINGEDMPTWAHVKKKIEASGGKALEFKIERKGESQPQQIQTSAVFGENDNIFAANRMVGQIAGLTPESRSALVGVSDPKSAAGTAGLQSMDLIVAVNGKKVSYWRDLQASLSEAWADRDKTPLEISVRDIEHEDKLEATRKLKVAFPAGLTQDSDMAQGLGIEPAELYIYQIKKDSPADKAGILAKDKVVRIGEDKLTAWSDVLTHVKAFDVNSEGMDFTVVRNGAEKTFKIRPEMTKMMTQKGQEEKRFTIGIVSGFFPMGPEPIYYRISDPVKMLQNGLQETVTWTEFVVMSLVRLVQGEVSAKNVGGVITIGRVASHSFAAGTSVFLRTMAIISINLFLLNLLPVPILDGGHLVFYTIEGLRGAPLSMRKMELAQQIGLMLLMFLMVFAFFNDITNWWVNRG
jgi:regulator of sigma E protease